MKKIAQSLITWNQRPTALLITMVAPLLVGGWAIATHGSLIGLCLIGIGCINGYHASTTTLSKKEGN